MVQPGQSQPPGGFLNEMDAVAAVQVIMAIADLVVPGRDQRQNVGILRVGHDIGKLRVAG